MSLVSIAAIREHIESDLADAALQRLIDAAEADINSTVGVQGTEQETFASPLAGDTLYLRRPAASVASAAETVADTTTSLVASDYELRAGGRQLARLATGTNPRTYWGERVAVVYVPLSDEALRIECVISLVQLSVQNRGLRAERVGDYSADAPDWEAERERIMARLTSKHRLFA